MILGWLLKVLLGVVAAVTMPREVIPPVGTVTEDFLEFQMSGKLGVYLDGHLKSRIDITTSIEKRVREEVLESSATHQRSRVTFVTFKSTATMGNVEVPASFPAVVGQTFLLERKDGRLLAGHEDGSPLTDQEASFIHRELSGFGLRPTLRGPLTVGRKLNDHENLAIAPTAGGWTSGATSTLIGFHDPGGNPQVGFSMVGKTKQAVQGFDILMNMVGAMTVDLDGLGLDVIQGGVGFVDVLSKERGHQVVKRGLMTFVVHVGSKHVRSGPQVEPLPATP